LFAPPDTDYHGRRADLRFVTIHRRNSDTGEFERACVEHLRLGRTTKPGDHSVKIAEMHAAAFAVAMFWPCGAQAQDLMGLPVFEGDESGDLTAVDHAVEVTVGTGYAQAFGHVAAGQPNLTEVGLAGWSVQLGIGYRLIPQLALGTYAGGAMYGRTDVDAAILYSVVAGFKVDWHFLPAARELDPWVSLGAGWRGYWIEQDQGATSLQGFDVAKLQAGLDYRVERRAAIGPIIGLDLSRFLWESSTRSEDFQTTSHPKLNTFVFVGFMGRIDIPNVTQGSAQVASR
jgi:hypothetical protein